MKKMFSVVLVSVAVLVSIGVETPDRERHLALRRAAVARRISSEGGYVESVSKGGKVSIVDAQSVVPRVVLETVAASIRRTLWLAVDVNNGETGKQYRPKEGYPIVISLTDTGNGTTLLVAPEQCWAVIDTKSLSNDSPSEKVLADRTQKEIWRALAIILGVSNSSVQPCVMSQVNSLNDLDAIKTNVPSPEPFIIMGRVALHLGLSRVVRASYRRACQEGWAPLPTNDVQKAIFEQVKADKERGPTNPLTIQPPNQKK